MKTDNVLEELKNRKGVVFNLLLAHRESAGEFTKKNEDRLSPRELKKLLKPSKLFKVSIFYPLKNCIYVDFHPLASHYHQISTIFCYVYSIPLEIKQMFFFKVKIGENGPISAERLGNISVKDLRDVYAFSDEAIKIINKNGVNEAILEGLKDEKLFTRLVVCLSERCIVDLFSNLSEAGNYLPFTDPVFRFEKD